MLKKSHEKKSHYMGNPTNTPVSLLLAARRDVYTSFTEIPY